MTLKRVVSVAALIFLTWDENLLLVEKDYGQKCSLPGGTVEANETIEQAAIREPKEETGLNVKLKRMVAVYHKAEEGTLAITFEAEDVGAQLEACHEIRGCEFFSSDDLPSHLRVRFSLRVIDYIETYPHIVFSE